MRLTGGNYSYGEKAVASFSVGGMGSTALGRRYGLPLCVGGGTRMGQGLCLRKGKWGREVAPRLKALAALVEASGSVPSSHMVAHNHAKSQGI